MAERETFLRLLLQHETEVRAFVGSLVRDRHVREDVFQEVALALWAQFERYDVRRSFGAWARGIAANKILQRRHQDRRFPVTLSDTAVLSVLAAFDRTEEGNASSRLEALRECLQKVPEPARQLLALRYERGLPCAEIARQTRRTLDAVYQALSRLRSALEECIRRRLAAGGA
ncbi:MAG TPA: sigma-70 family RNA polymerase sigma factor [Planctomycetota bacterium]|nr:sigma-70 family RNA polymerase sigma factor [Planctomycetota bacterium]HRR80871.1 sigma-70 family RNA polymerase sigma factor [Planctomycetota bacterium]HRT94722.1 sigma-70 family RNA polymerase sigma factor [Planctomycetota bacterium]